MKNEYLEMLQERNDIVVYPINPQSIRGFEFLRGYCERNTCGQYDKNWMCPPHIPDVQELNDELRGYKKAFLVRKDYMSNDPFHGDVRMKKDFFDELSRINESLEDKDHLVLGTGECKYCNVCKKMFNEPCINKEKALASIESYGIEVNHLMKMNNIKKPENGEESFLIGLVCLND